MKTALVPLAELFWNNTHPHVKQSHICCFVENTLKLRNLKKLKWNKLKESQNDNSRAGYKKRSGRTFHRQTTLLDKRDTLGIGDITRGNVQLPVITQLSEDNTKPAISWAPNKGFLRLQDTTITKVEEDDQVEPPPAMSTPVPSRPSQTSATPLSLDVCAVPCVSVPTTKSRRDSTSPQRRSTRPREDNKLKTTKVFWSEAQTLNQNQFGMSFPGAPPCTPTAGRYNSLLITLRLFLWSFAKIKKQIWIEPLSKFYFLETHRWHGQNTQMIMNNNF